MFKFYRWMAMFSPQINVSTRYSQIKTMAGLLWWFQESDHQMRAFMNVRSLLNPQRVFSSTFWLSVSTFETFFYIVPDIEICPLNRINWVKYVVHVRKPFKMGHQNYEPSLLWHEFFFYFIKYKCLSVTVLKVFSHSFLFRVSFVFFCDSMASKTGSPL